MKRTIFSLMAILLCLGSFAQTPQPVYSFAKQYRPLSWQKEQEKAWKMVLEKDPKNANAWYNYYRVRRNLNSEDTTDTRTRKEKAEAMNALLLEMEKQVPESYEYNLCRWMHEGNNYDEGKFLPYLKKAIALGSGRWEHLDCAATWAEVERNINERDNYCAEWFRSGEVSGGLMHYNYNVIAGMKPNAIVFTAGDNDTYPIWILQSQGIRKDITVLNLYLMRIDIYRERIFKELGVEPFKSPDSQEPDSMKAFEQRFRREIIRHVARNRNAYPVYVGLTVEEAYCGKDGGSYNSSVADNLYLTGLAYEYSEKPLDNMAWLKRNFEQVYSLDYIDKPFYQDISQDIVRHINGNYIVPMLKLYDHYKTAGELQKMNWVKEKLLKIAEGRDNEAAVKKHLN